MTANRVQVAIEKFGKKIPTDSVSSFKRHLMDADDSCMDEFMFLTIKSPLTALLLSIFLGAFGVDRFYIGDKGIGFAKIFLPLGCSLLSFIPFIGWLLSLVGSLAIMIWRFADIFLVYRDTKRYNYERLTGYLHQKRKKYSTTAKTSAYSYEEEMRAKVESGEYTPLVSNYKPVYSDEETPQNIQSKQASQNNVSIKQDGADESEIAAPIAIDTPDIDIIFTCPVCSQKMRITTVASKYCCPKCSTIFPYKNVVK